MVVISLPRLGSSASFLRTPALYHLFPVLQAVTAPRVLGHHTSLAIGSAHLVQDIGDVSAGLGEPRILLAARLARFVDEGIVLIRAQETIAPAGRAQHQNGIPARREWERCATA